MKNSAKQRVIATIIVLFVAVGGVFAQITGSGSLVAKGTVGSGEEFEYVTVNSIMPYQITPFDWGTMAGIMNASEYNWSVVNGTGTSSTVYQNNGISALTEFTVGSGFFQESSISIKWSAVGTYTINVAEKSRPTVGVGCLGNTEALPVTVLPWPVAGWGTNTDPSVCGLSGNVTIALACTGSQALTVSYDVYYTAMATGSTRTKLTASPSTVALSNAGYNIAATGSIIYNVSSGTGKYEIELVNITDKITEKSFGTLALSAAARNATAAELPGAPYVFYSLPSPTTQPIQHIRNL